MITFKTITIRNFLSFGNKKTTIPLDDEQITMIMGKNYDTGSIGGSKNGVGKSTIFQAISWVLFGEGINNIKQDNFINIKNKKKLEVELVFNVNNDEFKVFRGRKPNKFVLLMNDKPYTHHSIASNEEAIIDILGMDAELFFNTCMLSTNIEPFMNKKPAQQKLFMENLLSLNLIAEYVSRLKEDRKGVETELVLEENNHKHYITSQAELQERLSYLTGKSEEWEIDKNNKIESLTDELEKLKSIDLEEIKEILDRNSEVKKEVDLLEKNISDLTQEKNENVNALELTKKDINLSILKEKREVESAMQDELELKIDAIQRKYQDKLGTLDEIKDDLASVVEAKREAEYEVKDLKKDLRSIKAEHSSLKKGECHFCKQSYTDPELLDEYHTNILNLEKNLSKLEEQVDEYVEVVTNLKTEIQSKEQEYLDEFNEKTKKTKSNHKKELEEIVSKIDTDASGSVEEIEEQKELVIETWRKDTEQIKSKIEELEDSIEECEFTLSDVDVVITNIYNIGENLKKENESVNPYVEQITDVSSKIGRDFDTSIMDELKKKQDHYTMLIKMLSDNKSFLRKKLVFDSVTVINGIVNDFLIRLDSPHAIKINDDLTVDIDYMNRSVSYGNLSNGERLRLNIAISLAFRQMIESTGKSVNLLAIDELLDNGLDTAGFHKVFSLIKSFKNKTTFIISHREELITEVDKVMVVEKRNGFSSIV